MSTPKEEWSLFPPELRARLLEADPSLAELEQPSREDWDELVEKETERLRKLLRRQKAREEAKDVLAVEEGGEPQQNIILMPSRHNLGFGAWLRIFNTVCIAILILYFLF